MNTVMPKAPDEATHKRWPSHPSRGLSSMRVLFVLGRVDYGPGDLPIPSAPSLACTLMRGFYWRLRHHGINSLLPSSAT